MLFSHRIRPRALALPLACAVVLAACYDEPGATGGTPAAHEGVAPNSLSGPSCAESSKNDEVRNALAPTCASCHGAGSNKPFFASLRSFETLLVYEPSLVTPGKPEASRLVALLEGTAGGTIPQMPPPESFASLDREGKTKISMADVREWIAHIGASAPEDTTPNRAAPTMRRATAEEMLVSLLSELDLDPVKDFGGAGEKLPLMSPDAPITFSLGDSAAMSRARGAWARFSALGGARTLSAQPRQSTITTTAVQVLTHVSQEWCSLAVKKPNSALLRDAKLADTSQSNAPAIKKNIRYLMLRMLGVVASDAEVDRTFNDVFLPLEPEGATVAWTGVCAGLVRRPEWLLL